MISHLISFFLLPWNWHLFIFVSFRTVSVRRVILFDIVDLILSDEIATTNLPLMFTDACSCNQYKSVSQIQLQSVLQSRLQCADFSTHSVTRAATNALTFKCDLLSVNYDYPYRSSYPLYNSLDTCRFLHTSVPVYADPSKPSSKIEESVQALKELRKEQEQPVENETKIVVKKSLKQKVVDELVHYYHGFRLLFIDINVSAKLLWRILRGKQLSRREHNLVRSNTWYISFFSYLILGFFKVYWFLVC